MNTYQEATHSHGQFIATDAISYLEIAGTTSRRDKTSTKIDDNGKPAKNTTQYHYTINNNGKISIFNGLTNTDISGTKFKIT